MAPDGSQGSARKDARGWSLGGLLSPSQDPDRRGLLWLVLQFMLRGVFATFTRVRVYERQYVPQTGGALILSNHQSYLDPVLVALWLRRPMSFLARASLFRNPLFSWLIRSLHAYPVEQGRGDLGAMKETIRRLHEGHLLNIFPEGSRTEDGRIGKIERGAALVIRRANVPIIPAVIDGAFQAWPIHRKWPRPHRIKVKYGPPLNVEGLDAQQILDLIDQTLRRMLEELRSYKVR